MCSPLFLPSCPNGLQHSVLNYVIINILTLLKNYLKIKKTVTNCCCSCLEETLQQVSLTFAANVC